MSRAKFPSKLSLPQSISGDVRVLDYLIERFPRIGRDVWRQRVADGKVHWHDGSLITADSRCEAQQRVYYYRELADEALIPFAEEVLFRDEHILLAFKPHFLPVTPGGKYIDECLQNRLRRRTGEQALQAVHRLDRATAGLVLFCVNPDTRHLYHELFASRSIDKSYQAIAAVDPGECLVGRQWEVKNRLARGDPPFLTQVVEGMANSRSLIRCLRQSADKALFELRPVSGKTHQLRVHMQALGWPVLDDTFYPQLQAQAADDWSHPLQLLAKKLSFVDPVTQQHRVFTCDADLALS